MSPGFADTNVGETVEPCPLRKKTWIEIELVGEDGKPVPRAQYRIMLPDGSMREGTLDEQGVARAEFSPPGTCLVSFPELDSEAWKGA